MKGCMNFEEEGTEVVGGRERGHGQKVVEGKKETERGQLRNIRELIQLWECGREFH